MVILFAPPISERDTAIGPNNVINVLSKCSKWRPFYLPLTSVSRLCYLNSASDLSHSLNRLRWRKSHENANHSFGVAANHHRCSRFGLGAPDRGLRSFNSSFRSDAALRAAALCSCSNRSPLARSPGWPRQSVRFWETRTRCARSSSAKRCALASPKKFLSSCLCANRPSKPGAPGCRQLYG